MSPSERRRREEIYAHYGLTCPPRYATLRNFDHPTYGGKVAKIAAALGTPLMPWQRYVADTTLEIDPTTGLPAYRTFGVRVPRQSGKTSLILPIAVHRGMAWQRQRILYAAQSGTAAREKWEDEHVEALLASKLAPRIRVRKANGREAIIWKATRSLHGIATNTPKSGHGKTLHLGLADEYFAQVDYRIEAAWGPAQITVLSAQRGWFSTAGTHLSIPLNEETSRGRELVESGEPTSIAYFDWTGGDGSGSDGTDHASPQTWLTCMPALCPTPPPCRCSPNWRHTVFASTIQSELDKADTPAKLAEWLRAYMNWTREDDDVVADPNVPTVEAWELLADEHSIGGPGMACAVDITPLRDAGAICAVGDTADGVPRGVVLEHGAGIDWMMQRIEAINKLHQPVAWALDDKGPAGTLVEPMTRAGIKLMDRKKPHRGGLWIMHGGEIGTASGRFADLVKQGGIVHRGQKVMSEALDGAATRPLGDGLWTWARRKSDADISPLVGMTEALAAWERYKHLLLRSGPNVW